METGFEITTRFNISKLPPSVIKNNYLFEVLFHGWSSGEFHGSEDFNVGTTLSVFNFLLNEEKISPDQYQLLMNTLEWSDWQIHQQFNQQLKDWKLSVEEYIGSVSTTK